MALNKYSLGDLITQRREKNPGGDLPIRGVSKEGLQPPKQIDADTSIYNLYYRNDFVYNPARMELGSIAFNDEYDQAICSSLYEVFYVRRTDLVIPEYLALFVKHPEFARYCNYIGNGSAREYCRFDNISGIPIYLPPIEEQRKIVHDYQVITDRIELLRKMNENLEEQALALFKGWFVSYQPFGGDMPNNWKTVTLSDVANMGAGVDRPDVCVDNKTEECNIPIYSNGIEKDGLYGFTDVPRISKESVTVSARGTIGFVCLRTVPYVPIVRLVTLVPKESIVTAKFLYLYLRNLNIQGTGSTQQQLTVPDFAKTELILPPYSVISQFTNLVTPFYQTKIQNEYEIDCLGRITETILSGVSA